jgi:ubiquinone/menaquinone biosynthesis C-methylase UbiE/uncharacterized protein YbaR (Trm112 family)
MPDFSMLRCPQCKGALAVSSDLHCARCNVRYQIVDGIPIMLPDRQAVDGEQNLAVEKEFYEGMFSGLKGLEDGHCIVYGQDRVYDFVSRLPRGTLLEAGCGAGHHGVTLSKRGFKVTSMDLTLNGVKAARRLAQHEHQDVFYLCGDIKRLPFDDNSFDICFCSLILHHFISLDNLMQELARVTRKYFVCFEVSALDPISFVRFNVINPTIGISNISKNQRALFPSRLEKILRRHGFSEFVTRYEDMHEHIGRSPKSTKAKILRSYQSLMRVFPEKYSQNKFLLQATKGRP